MPLILYTQSFGRRIITSSRSIWVIQCVTHRYMNELGMIETYNPTLSRLQHKDLWFKTRDPTLKKAKPNRIKSNSSS